MGPIVAEVEYVDELLPGFEMRQLQNSVIANCLVVVLLRLRDPHTSAVGEPEFMEMCPVPSRKCLVNRIGQIGK
jgi:hypothetical protein